MKQLASALTGTQGERVALCDVNVHSVLQDLLAETTIEQTYRNDEAVNIEAVYTFALPLDAVLLDLVVEIGGRSLSGVVVEKRRAEASYEDAVAAGDAAVMLQAIEPGLYTMNVGNLLPRETAKIVIRYALLYRWTGDRLRFFLPTTIAPRYGASRHQPHQTPEASLTVENQFSLRVEMHGALREAQLSCPTHAVQLARTPEKVTVSLVAREAVMDRDFVLNVRLGQARRSFALSGADGDGLAVVASFQPFFPGLQKPRPLDLAILIDCSGSMNGDSMAQAKQALDGILDGLQRHDNLALIAFGSTTKSLAPKLLPCGEGNLAEAREFARSLDADMGGTEIGGALRETYALLGKEEPRDVFLVTDGAVADWQDDVEEAKRSGHRIFTVGVGSAVSEGFVRELAENTGGECEMVSPREGMAERVVRHFERMRAPRASRVLVHWPEGVTEFTPATIGTVFEGDTVLATARFEPALRQGVAILEVHTDQGEVTRQELSFTAPTSEGSAERISTVARVAAASRLKVLDEGAALKTALHYRLISPWTHWLVVAERSEAERPHVLPELRKVPQTLAAGWGGTGSVAADVNFAFAGDVFGGLFGGTRTRAAVWAEEDCFELPAESPEPHERLLELINADASRLSRAGAASLLQESGLDRYFGDVLQQATDLGLGRDLVAAMILARVLGGSLGTRLPHSATATLARLKEFDREVSATLRDVGQRAEQLRSGIDHLGASGVLERLPDFGPLHRLMGIPAWLERLDERLSQSEQRLEHEQASRA